MTLLEMEPVKRKAPMRLEGLANMDSTALMGHITTRSVELYKDQPKGLQVEAVSSLVRGGHTFVCAGTGFGKTRISEMYFGLFDRKVVVLVLVPLDSLGDDQVREKKSSKGNSALFTCDEFQAILALIVVDEAHMVYLWGLVASKQSKNLIIFARLEDQAIFRPAYGHIGTRLMATNNVPLLLLSATCRPEAVAAITSSLMLQPSELAMVDGELTRPEIRFIRVKMESTLSSCDDLLRIFAPHTTTPASKAVPMIIYSGTRNRTFQVMKVVNEARDTKKHEYDPQDPFIRRYHAVTGDEDKERTITDFGADKVPVISATMALGLGQNLKRVRTGRIS
ncbi:ATP-dependent DNA helicase sgs1 [Puccinia graminis f. sp. tritici]|uniref:DNA 3'-5' helicase n=1 Tax=Puccinia graminis f. sp. tritici TaxID=56615 RepID=A0A5B0MQ82_PUCGR|nr:ATP-dependent DNA helicase sgs1 [Puccinia graminis f. sp. tritici]